MFPFYYYRVPGPGQLPSADRNLNSFMDLLGRNDMKAPLRLYPGKPNAPSWSLGQDERTGPFSDGAGRTGWTFGGEKRVVWTALGAELWDEYGNLVGVCGPTDFFATVDDSGGVFPGAAVLVPPGTLTVNTVARAGDPDLAVGVALFAAADEGETIVRTCGLVTLPDWTAVVGTATLEDPEYYLDAAGAWTATSGAQWVASRVGPLTAKLRC